MHLPTGPTAVYHHHHHHHLAALQHSPPNSDWNLNNNNNNSINNLKIGSGSGSSSSILDPPTSSGTNSPPGSNSSSSQDLWWTERLILEAQAEYPGELGKGPTSFVDRKWQRTRNEYKESGIFGTVMGAVWKLRQIVHCDTITLPIFIFSFPASRLTYV